MVSGIDARVLDEVSDKMPVDAVGDGIVIMEYQDFMNYDDVDASDSLIYLIGSVIKRHGIDHDIITLRR